MTVPCEGQLLLMTPPFDDLVPEPIVLGTMQFCPGLMDQHGQQVRPCCNSLLTPTEVTLDWAFSVPGWWTTDQLVASTSMPPVCYTCAVCYCSAPCTVIFPYV